MRGRFLRRSPRLAIVFAVVALAIGARRRRRPTARRPFVHAQLRRADDQHRRRPGVRQELLRCPRAATGPSGGWSAALNPDSNYAREACSVAKDGASWLKARSKVANRAIVLDVDDTTLTTWNYELFSNWDFNATTNAYFVGLGNPPASSSTFTGNMFPATPCMLDLVEQADAMGYSIFWITGRGDSQHKATIANLVSDTAAGFLDITDRLLHGGVPVGSAQSGNPITVPEIDAEYPTATTIDTGHGKAQNGGQNFADGLFTKPVASPVNDYPSYLNKPEFCAAAIASKTSCATIPYKSGTRAYIESQGYDIVADFGDQFSDLIGGFADKTFKMPNPNYYLP